MSWNKTKLKKPSVLPLFPVPGKHILFTYYICISHIWAHTLHNLFKWASFHLKETFFLKGIFLFKVPSCWWLDSSFLYITEKFSIMWTFHIQFCMSCVLYDAKNFIMVNNLDLNFWVVIWKLDPKIKPPPTSVFSYVPISHLPPTHKITSLSGSLKILSKLIMNVRENAVST